jgi:hypothetical protein
VLEDLDDVDGLAPMPCEDIEKLQAWVLSNGKWAESESLEGPITVVLSTKHF